jgi:hypothetical protein
VGCSVFEEKKSLTWKKPNWRQTQSKKPKPLLGNSFTCGCGCNFNCYRGASFRLLNTALTILKAQLAQAEEDVEKLMELRENGLKNPVEFIERLVSKVLYGLDPIPFYPGLNVERLIGSCYVSEHELRRHWTFVTECRPVSATSKGHCDSRH